MNRVFIFLLAITLTVRAADSVVIFNEIHYHPADELTQTEWIELRNLNAVDVDIGGWRLEGGVDYTFANNVRIPGGGFIVVAKTPGQIPGSYGPFTGILDNGGEEIRLVNRSDRAMDVLDYSDDGDWPSGPDGSGATLSRRNSYTVEPGPLAWSASNQLGGTPGAVNYPGPTDPPTVTNIIALNSSWKYRDDNVAPPATWKDTGFDDSSWSSGASLLYAGSPNITGAGEGLYGYWPMEETSGTNVPNVAPGGTNGTIFNGVTWVNDATRGKVLNFDGVDGYVRAGSIPQPTTSNNFTWSFWVNSTQTSNTNVVLGNRYSPTNGVDFSPREFVKFTCASFEFHRQASGEDIDYVDFPLNVWTHHAVVKQGTSMTYYRNGVAMGTPNPRTITVGLNNPQPFYFGGDQVNENWGGRMDDVATWTKALPASSIAGLANGTLTPLTAPTGSSGGTLTTQLALGPTTHYFRRAFNFTGDKSRTTLALQHLLDDGAVVYLNGTEVYRVNMPGGAVTHSTPASNDITSTALSSSINIPVASLLVGTNVVAVEVHQHTANPDMVFGISLVSTEVAGPTVLPGNALVLNEVGGANDTTFRVELANLTSDPINLTGYQLRGSNGASYALTGTLAAGALLSLDETQIGFRPISGERLFVLNTATQRFIDGRTVTNALRARTSSGDWAHPNAATFGAANTFTFHDEIVINEIMYHAPGTSQEQWIELYNKSGASVDLSGWHFTDGIDFTFPPGATIGAGQYALAVWDVAAFNAVHPGLPRVYGPFNGGLSGRGERVRLRAADDNLADEVEYFTGGRWPEFADGGGSSLELRNPSADNMNSAAWAASAATGTWVNVQYDFSGANLEGNPTYYNEFLVGMVAGGEAYIDDMEVIEDPTGSPISLLQNGNFSGGTAAAWRFEGNHRTSVVVDDPDAPGNKVLKIVASGYTEHMSNHCETTLKNGASFWTINPAKTYRIKYRARWAGGSNRLHTRLYFNRGAHQELLPMPTTGGTPGAQNSRFVANAGPTFSGATHSPAVPAALAGATVSARITDSDGVASANLFYSVNEGGFLSIAMTNNGGVWSATIPGQSQSAKANFYIQATDTLGATATFPANGAAGRAIVPWNDNQAALTLPSGVSPHNVRIVMTTSDSNNLLLALNNVMSNEYLPCTVIYDERDVYYGTGVHLKGSEHGRAKFASRTGFHISFPPDGLFLGQHSDVAADRSGAGDVFSQAEMLVKRTLNTVGGIPVSEDDLCRLIAPGVATGPAILIKAKVDSNEFLDNWLSHGSDGTYFEYELTYPLYNAAGIPSSTDNGTVEGNKLTQDNPGPPGVGVRALSPGLSKEEYRWFWLIKNNRSADNYAPLITGLTALGGPGGTTFINQTNALLDVDGWLRDMAGPIAWAAGDNYCYGAGHNALFFIKPNGRLLFVPWDMDFTASSGSGAGLIGNTEMSKLTANPGNLRAYYGHLLDLCDRAFNTTYLTYWAQHYTKFLNEDLTSYMSSFVGPRESFIRSTISSQIPSVAFAISPAPPASVGANSITLTGTGWVNIREFRRADTGAVLPATWTGTTSWSLSYALVPGPNAISIQAYNFQGVLVGTATANVNNTLSPPAPKDWLRITELHYHPANPTTPGEIAASTDSDDFEFIELQNFASSNLDIAGCKFTVGVDFVFPSPTTLAPGERIMVVRNSAAFNARYGAGPRIAGAYGPGDSLSNSGETITLVDSTGAVIQSFTYDDSLPWPTNADGPGYSLVPIAPLSNLDRSLASNWRASTAIGGNPNAADSASFTGSAGADNDADGLNAFLEYALGTSDATPDPVVSTLTREASGTYLFTITRALNADDAIPAVEVSTDLVNWTGGGVLASSAQSGLRVTESWRITPPVGATKLFARFKATSR